MGRRIARILLSIAATLFTAVPNVHADWPRFRGPTGMGISTAKDVPLKWSAKENLAWKVKLPRSGTSSPILVGKHIYLTAYSGYNVPGQPVGEQEKLRLHVLCLNKTDGTIVWDKTIEPKLPEEARIRENHGYASATPVADAENVYAFFGKSGVVAFTLAGKELWRADVGKRSDGFGSGASPMLAGDLLIVNASVESSTLFAFDKKTGKEAWKVQGIREAYNTPILIESGGKQELVMAMQGSVFSLDPASGAKLWTCRTDITWYMVPSVVAENDIVGCLGGRSGIASLAIKLGGKGEVTASHRLWTTTKGSNVPSPILHDGHLYWINDTLGIAYCADVKTGKLVYEERVTGGGQVYASPVLAEGRIYYVGRDGRTYVLAAKPALEVLATNDLRDGSQFNASPAVEDGRIYLRSEQYLYCVGKK